MQVTNVTVGYDRKRQPAQYESAGASVSFSATASATVGDNEDYVEIARKLLGDAKTLVLVELGIVAAGQSASAHVVAAAAPKTEGAAPAKETAAQKRVRLAAEAAAANPPASDIPGETAAPAATGASDIPGEGAPAASKPALVNNDIPEGSKPTAVVKDTTGKFTAADVHAAVSKAITDKKVDREQVKALTAKFGKARIQEIEEARLGEYMAELKKLTGETSGVADDL